jgi:hypothetical protein
MNNKTLTIQWLVVVALALGMVAFISGCVAREALALVAIKVTHSRRH